MILYLWFFLSTRRSPKKAIEYKFETSDNYSNYITKYLTAIKDINDNKYDKLTHENSKFLFYQTTSLK